MKSEPEKLLQRHATLVHSDMVKVISHMQRKVGEWIINTLMIEGYNVPFRYKRKRQYRDLGGARVNITYYAAAEVVGGIEVEVMKVVRIKRS